MSQELERFQEEQEAATGTKPLTGVLVPVKTSVVMPYQQVSDFIPVDDCLAMVLAGASNWSISSASANGDNIAGRFKSFRWREGPATRMEDMLGKEIVVQHVFAHHSTFQDEAGEVKMTIRWLYISHDDKVIVGGGPWCARTLNKFMASTGLRLPFDPPIRFVVRDRQTKNNRRIWWLEPVGIVETALDGHTK
jgi:hypothetical protein